MLILSHRTRMNTMCLHFLMRSISSAASSPLTHYPVHKHHVHSPWFPCYTLVLAMLATYSLTHTLTNDLCCFLPDVLRRSRYTFNKPGWLFPHIKTTGRERQETEWRKVWALTRRLFPNARPPASRTMCGGWLYWTALSHPSYILHPTACSTSPHSFPNSQKPLSAKLWESRHALWCS